MNKRVLRKLMLLNNAKANEKLGGIADEIISSIIVSEDNDEIFEKLCQMKEFVYIIPEQVLKVTNHIAFNTKPNQTKKLDRKYITGVFGKSHKDLILETLGLLDEIRYSKTKEVLHLLLKLSKSSDSDIKKRVDEIFKKVSGYNYHALKQFGVSAQKSVIDFLEKNINKFDFDSLKVLFSELLKPSFEGTEMKDERTLSWLSGPLIVNKDLKDVRDRSINLLFDLFNKAKNLYNKKSILGLLTDSLSFPHTGVYKEDFEDMVSQNAIKLIANYRGIVFDKNGTIVAELPIVQEIETQLNQIIDRPIKKADKVAKEFVNKLDKNETYYVSRLLTTSARDYRGKQTWEESEASRKTEVNKLFEAINSSNIEKYTGIFEQAGKYLKRPESWEWREYSTFLVRLAEQKPELAIKILNSSALIQKKFLTEMLEGFRKAKNWKAWDKYATLAIQSKVIERIEQIFWSINLVDKDKVNDQVRKLDIKLLDSIISDNSIMKPKNVALHHAIIWALIAVYSSDPTKVEMLIESMFEKNKDLMSMYLHAIEIGIIRQQINLQGWRDNTIKLIVDHLIRTKDIDHDLQNILIEIEKDQSGIALQIFIQRINHAMKQKQDIDVWDRYEAIPDYFDDKLAKLLRTNKTTHSEIKNLVKKMVENKNYLFNWKVNELIKQIGGDIKKNILNELIDSKDDTKLEVAVSLMKEFEAPDIEQCFRVISNSSGPDSKVWNSVASRLYTTGVMTGEYGIRDNYKRTLDKIKIIKSKEKKDQNIQKFADRMIGSFEESIERENKRVKEDLLLRKIEFEN